MHIYVCIYELAEKTLMLSIQIRCRIALINVLFDDQRVQQC